MTGSGFGLQMDFVEAMPGDLCGWLGRIFHGGHVFSEDLRVVSATQPADRLQALFVDNPPDTWLHPGNLVDDCALVVIVKNGCMASKLFRT